MNNFTLTDDQQTVFDQLKDFDLWRPAARYCLLMGAAGTGKTTLVSMLIERWVADGVPITISALTHKAAAVMRTMLQEKGIHEPVKTIHSVLKCIPKENYETGSTDLFQVSMPDIASQTLLIVDESSMLGEDMDIILRTAADELCLMVLYIADRNQLPPVNTKDNDDAKDEIIYSPIFDRDDIEKFELTETVRASGDSPITKLAREFIESHHLPDQSTMISNDQGEVILSNHSEFMDHAKRLVTEAHLNNDPNHVIILAYRNESVTHYNEKLREHICGFSDPFIPGERLVVNDACKAKTYDDEASDLFNNEVVKVEKSKPSEKYGLEGFEVKLTCGRICFAAKSTGQLLRAIRIAKQDARKSGQWGNYFALKKSVADLRPVYAVTVHKSQSSSYTNVLIDLGDIHAGNNKEMLKTLCYTAITRARKRVILAGYQAFWNAQKIESVRGSHTW